MNKWFWILLAFVLVVGLTVGYLVKSSKVERVIVIDTLVQERVITELSRDTVIKWYEKVVWKNVTPEKEVTQTADTVFVETVKYLDLMLKVDKKGDKVIIYAFNENNNFYVLTKKNTAEALVLYVFKGGEKTLKFIDYIYSEVNRDEVYENCTKIEELDEFLKRYDFTRVETDWTGHTWGDALYIKIK